MKSMILLLVFLFIRQQTAWSADSAKTKEDQKLMKATFAGGCFWCMEPPFEKLKGVKKVVSGYTGGHTPNPTYEQVCFGTTGHAEAVEIAFDPAEISYENLLEIFWRNIDPTDPTGQFADKGSQYRTAIFYHNKEQKRMALESKEKLAQSGIFDKPIVTEITPAATFYPAENYHQGFCRLNPTRYNTYRYFSGRDQYLDSKWGKDREKHE